MTVKQKLELAKALITVVENDLVQPDGSILLTSVLADLKLASDVEAAFVAAGVAIPDKTQVDQALAGAVALVNILGLK